MQVADSLRRNSPWPHRLAIVLACATFPLLWVGGLVTTTKAGMAVPDWPNTYGYNLFLYPWQSWLAAPWDLFVEHGHRLLAATVGFVTIALLVALLRCENRRWMRGLGFAALALVIFQGALGGMRVLFDERTLAMLHGMTGPLFFSLSIALVVFTSATWRNGGTIATSTDSSTPAASVLACAVRVLATVTAVLVYLQLVLGAILRHIPIDTQPAVFMLAVKFHLFLAAVLTLHIVLLAWFILWRVSSPRPLGRMAWLMCAIVVVQLALGVATWIVKYSFPGWVDDWITVPKFAVEDGGWLQTHVVTAHVATGSALLGISVALALYAHRLLSGPVKRPSLVTGRLEAAI